MPPGTSDASGAAKELPAGSRMPKRETVEHARKTLNEFNALARGEPTAFGDANPGVVAGRVRASTTC